MDTLEAEVQFMTTKFGPLILARRALEPLGCWPALLADVRRLLADHQPGEYS